MSIYPPNDELATAQLIRDFVLANLHKHFSPLQLSKQFKVTEKFITKRIRELLHASLAELAREKRMQLAITLVLEGHPQKTIAARLGYSSKSYFSAAFKKHYGSAPNVYVKKK